MNASEIGKKVLFFRFVCKSQTQEGDFYGVLQFLDSGFTDYFPALIPRDRSRPRVRKPSVSTWCDSKHG